jgi:hypothetical protein
MSVGLSCLSALIRERVTATVMTVKGFASALEGDRARQTLRLRFASLPSCRACVRACVLSLLDSPAVGCSHLLLEKPTRMLKLLYAIVRGW